MTPQLKILIAIWLVAFSLWFAYTQGWWPWRHPK